MQSLKFRDEEAKEFIDTMGIEVRNNLFFCKTMSGTLEDQFLFGFWFRRPSKSTVRILRDFTKDITMESLILAQDER